MPTRHPGVGRGSRTDDRRAEARRPPIGSQLLLDGVIRQRSGDKADHFFLGRAGDVPDSRDLTETHDLDAISDIEHEVHVVTDTDDGIAAITQLADEAHDVRRLPDT